uniref:hypothetical protein n=1 Tax=Lachnospira sp. TaxID=2049031 RepID=UPI004029AC9E
MEESEAIRELHKIRPRGGIIPEKRAEALDVAIQALEKQIPMKPIKGEKQVVRYVNTYYCPTCELGITGTNIAKWCYHCGQKLDWSDEE